MSGGGVSGGGRVGDRWVVSGRMARVGWVGGERWVGVTWIVEGR